MSKPVNLDPEYLWICLQSIRDPNGNPVMVSLVNPSFPLKSYMNCSNEIMLTYPSSARLQICRHKTWNQGPHCVLPLECAQKVNARRRLR